MKLLLPDQEIPFTRLPFDLPDTENVELNSLFSFIREWFSNRDYIEVKTSGSTGTPKIIQLQKQHLKNSAAATYSYFKPWNTKPLLLALPAHYIAGKMMVVRALEYNLPLIWVEPSTQPLKLLNIPVQFAAFVPNQAAASVNLLNFNRVEKLIIGGAPVTPQLQKELQNVTTKCYATYGMTETATHVALRPLNGSDPKRKFTFINGITGSTNAHGLLTIHAPQLGAPQLQTQDIVNLTGNSFTWRGRVNFTVNSGGLKIQPEEMEDTLASKIPVRFYFWSEPDAVLGEKLVLVLEGKESEITINQIQNTINTAIANKKYRPKKIYFVERFKYSANQKIMRKETFEYAKPLKS